MNIEYSIRKEMVFEVDDDEFINGILQEYFEDLDDDELTAENLDDVWNYLVDNLNVFLEEYFEKHYGYDEEWMSDSEIEFYYLDEIGEYYYQYLEDLLNGNV